MTSISLIACAKTKGSHPTLAGLLYESPLYRKSLLYALSHSDVAYILSAKHGLLSLDEKIAPYELTLRGASKQEKSTWTKRVVAQIKSVIKPRDTIIFLAGSEYDSGLLYELAAIGCRTEIPLKNLSMGQRLKQLGILNAEHELGEALRLFYHCMSDVYRAQGGGRLLAECSGRMDWPERGVYFLIEDEVEACWRSRKLGMPRITRVGTHAVSLGSKTTLWDRISTHRGTSLGAGSHRSSIFRLHVGKALVTARADIQQIASWGVGQTSTPTAKKKEEKLEREVSKTLGAMRIVWLNVGDSPSAHSDRAFIEQNSIGVLSRSNILAGVPRNWLGLHSAEYHIALAGLWNLNHLFMPPHESFIRVLQHYVDVTLGRTSPSEKSVAPEAWYKANLKKNISQLSLFADEK